MNEDMVQSVSYEAIICTQARDLLDPSKRRRDLFELAQPKV